MCFCATAAAKIRDGWARGAFLAIALCNRSGQYLRWWFRIHLCPILPPPFHWSGCFQSAFLRRSHVAIARAGLCLPSSFSLQGYACGCGSYGARPQLQKQNGPQNVVSLGVVSKTVELPHPSFHSANCLCQVEFIILGMKEASSSRNGGISSRKPFGLLRNSKQRT